MSIHIRENFMALVSTGYRLTVNIYDHGGNVSTLAWRYRSATTADFASALSGAVALIADLVTVTNGVIGGYNVTEVFEEDSFALPADGVENENKASITYSISGTSKKGNLKIPAPIGSGANNIFGITGAAANQVNLSATNLIAYTDNFRVVNQFEVSDGEALDVLLVGKRVSAKNNNG